MLELITTTQFHKDYKRIKKRGYKINLLQNTIALLLREEILEDRYKDHPELLGDKSPSFCFDHYCSA